MSAEELILIPKDIYDLLANSTEKPALPAIQTRNTSTQTDNVQPDNGIVTETEPVKKLFEGDAKWLPVKPKLLFQSKIQKKLKWKEY